MRYDMRANPAVKAVAVLLILVCGLLAVLGLAYCLYHWESIFEDGDYTDTMLFRNEVGQKRADARNLLSFERRIKKGTALSYLEQKDYEALKAGMDPANTNFRYIIRDNQTGEILLSSYGGTYASDKIAVGTPGSGSLVYVEVSGQIKQSEDSLDGVSDVTASLFSWQADYAYSQWYAPGEQYRYYDENGTLLFSDSNMPVQELALEYGVADDLTAHDSFYDLRVNYVEGRVEGFYLTLAAFGGFLLGTVLLMCCSGRRREVEGFVLNWQDRVPFDLYLALSGTGITLACALVVGSVEQVIYGWNITYSEEVMWIGLGSGGVLAALILWAALASTLATRCKTRTLLKNTLIWRICAWCCRIVGGLFSTLCTAVPLAWRVVLGGVAYLAINAFLSLSFWRGYEAFLWLLALLVFNGAVLTAICLWTARWKQLRMGTAAIVGGRPDALIDTSGMKWFPDLTQHAEQLNDLGSAINSAVEERMKSERMKSELITNVSHDLKTPLTSIINYVDLLKKEDIANERAVEYIEVLDRKSQRLKKLTEDLVEASKASTGALNVDREKLDLIQLAAQARGEYQEKLAARRLSLVADLPAEPLWVEADGRHLWRVLDNLLGNCVKYALEGTRVYLTLAPWDGQAVLTLKNISREELNIPADQLMERFVRGDESRATEGSGLGLSIARSLTELQGGQFALSVDGDLFKAVVRLPLTTPPEQPGT